MDERRAPLTAHPDPNGRLVGLQPRLRAAIVAKCGRQDLDDLLQEANVALLERAAADPEFLLQTDGYVVNWGVWRAQDANCRRYTYEGFAPLFPETGEDDDEAVASGAQLAAIPAPALDPDAAIAVRDALAGVTGKTRAVADGLLAGLRRKDIAEALGITSQSVGWHYSKLRRALAAAA
jgi:DNA-directed RNA polymerase specialized sigma24 family protein